MPARESAEFDELLVEQYGALTLSSSAFDEGTIAEHKRLALAMRILLHDTAHSTSLLAHGDWKDSIWFLDTSGVVYPDNKYPTASLLYRSIGPEAAFVSPLLDRYAQPCRCDPVGCRRKQLTRNGYPKWLGAESWAERVVLAGPAGANPITARKLIQWVANKDGGAHVDAQLPAAYHGVSRENSLGIRALSFEEAEEFHLTFSGEDGDPAENPVPATVRQLAFEVMWTLHRYFGLEEPTWVPRFPEASAVIEMPYASADSGIAPFDRFRLNGQASTVDGDPAADSTNHTTSPASSETSFRLRMSEGRTTHPWPLQGPVTHDGTGRR